MPPQKDVLIVDDEARNRKLLETFLSAEGYSVRSTEFGADALEAVAKTKPDLILMDLMMPGMDGFEVVRCLKADPSACHIPIVMVTALDDAAVRARLATAGISEVLIKPISRWELKSCLDKLLGENP